MSSVRLPKPAILAELALDRHAVIEASAGTGKTYTLEHLVIDILLEAKVSLEQILVVTFTEKAAAELRQRLRKKIGAFLEATGEAAEDGVPAWLLGEAERRVLARALVSFDGAAISTIHAFCQRMLVEHAFAHQRLFEQELVDGKAAFTRAFLGVLRSHLARDPERRRWLELWLRQRSLDELSELLFEVSARRGAIAPAFDEAGLRRGFSELAKIELTPGYLKPALGQAGFHPSATAAMLERTALLRRIVAGYRDTGDLAAALSALESEDAGLPGGLVPFLRTRLAERAGRLGLLTRLGEALALLEEGRASFASAFVQAVLPEVTARLARDKAESGELDFSDMLALLQESLRGPGGPELIATLRRRYRFALIDEFQDTDEIQWEVFARVFMESDDNRLFVIGDPKQAIYGFRGADVHTYLAAKAAITARGGRAVHLVDNYRSSGPLVQATNRILDQGRAPPFFTGEIRYDHPVRAAREKAGLLRGGARLSPIHVLQVVPEGERLSPSGARHTLAGRIAREIRDLLDPAAGFQLETETATGPLSPREIFVLTRSAREGHEVAEHLRRAGVPHAFYKQDGLFQTKEADDIRSLLAAIAEPHRRPTRFRAWLSPFFAVRLEELARMEELPGNHPLLKLLFDWKELADAKAYDRLFTRILEDSGLVERTLFLEESERELTNYLHIFEILTEEAARTRATLPELLETLGAFIARRRLPEGEDGNVQRLESEREAVQLMTQHKAKGLEAGVVFLFGGLDEASGEVHAYHEAGERRLFIGEPPPAAVAEEVREEDQRLLYVALTRAKARLYLPCFGRPGDDAPAGGLALSGSYRQLDDALRRVLVDAPPELFTVEPVPEAPRRPRRRGEADEATGLGRWSPPAELLAPPPAPKDLAALREAHAGLLITSYSRIKAARGGYHAPDADAEEVVYDLDGGLGEPAAESTLPGGTAAGRFLHEVLEKVPLASLTGAPGPAFWGARRDVRELILGALERHAIASEHLDAAAELLYTTLTAELQLGEVHLEAGIAGASRVLRELEFLYPIPELGDPPLDDASAAPRAARRGFVKGFIDLVLEHQGRAFVLDYKSDLLPSYAPAALERHVAENYALQAELYTLALVRLLGIRDRDAYEARFGGAVYCFLRGMRAGAGPSPGVYFSRPSWEEVLASEVTLRETDFGPMHPEPTR